MSIKRMQQTARLVFLRKAIAVMPLVTVRRAIRISELGR
jgi:hypothetical protein